MSLPCDNPTPHAPHIRFDDSPHTNCPGVGEPVWAGTCDAGSCDEETAAIVWTEDNGWLPMCAGHAMRELAAHDDEDGDSQ